MRRLPVYILIFAALATALATVAGRKPSAYDVEAAARKARALHAQSAMLEALDSMPAAYRVIDYAGALAPGDSALQYDRDRQAVFTEGSRQVYELLIDTLFARWLDNPTNLHDGHMYGRLAAFVNDWERAAMFLEAYATVNEGDWEGVADLCEASNRLYMSAQEGQPADTSAVLNAMTYVKDAERILGVSTVTTSQKVRSYMLLGDTASVDTAITLLLRENPDDSFSHFYAGDIYSRLGRDSMALEEVKIAYRFDPDSYDVARGLATAYGNLGDTVEHRRLVGEILDNVNFERDERLELLAEFLTEGIDESNPADVTLAEGMISRMLDEQSDARINEIKAIHLLHQSKSDEALPYFKTAFDMDSTKLNALLHAAMLLSLKEREQEVVDLTSRGFETWENDTTGTISISLSTFAMLAQAKADALTKLDSVGAVADFARHLADVLQEREVDPKQIATVLSPIAAGLQDNGSYDESIDLYELITAICTEPMLKNDYAYTLAVANRDLDKALQLVKDALLFNPDNPNALDTYAWVLFRRGEYDEARRAIDDAMAKSIKERKQNRAYKEDLEAGMIEDDNDDYDIEPLTDEQRAARNEHRQELAVKYQPDLWATLFEHAGDIYFMCKQPDEAVHFWEKALALDPENDMLKRKVEHRTFFYD